MSDDKPKPLDDVKEGLGLLFRAAKTAAKSIPTDNVESIVVDGAKEVGRAFETVATTIDDMWNKATGSTPPAADDAPPAAEAGADPPPTADAKSSAAPPAAGADAKPEGAKPDEAKAEGATADESRGPRVG